MKNIRSSNKKAESLIELIIALFLLSIVLFQASSLLKNFTSFSKRYEESLEKEDDINLFFSFIENDFTLYNTVSVKADSIHFEKKGSRELKSSDYYMDGDRIKRVAGSKSIGVTYFLSGLEDLSFAYNTEDAFVSMQIKVDGKDYKKLFSTKYLEVIEWRRAVQA